MTDCPRGGMRDLLPDWLHGTLAPTVREAVRAHVAGCAACAAEVEMLRTARAVMDRAPAVDVARIAAAVRSGADGGAGAIAPRRRRSAGMTLAAGIAAAVLAVAIVMAEFRSGGTSARSGEPSAADTPAREGVPAGGLQMGGGLADLADDELRTLLDQLERVDALPPDTPEPIGVTIGGNAT